MFKEVPKVVSDDLVEHYASWGYDPKSSHKFKVLCELAIEVREHRRREKDRWWRRLSRIRPGK